MSQDDDEAVSVKNVDDIGILDTSALNEEEEGARKTESVELDNCTAKEEKKDDEPDNVDENTNDHEEEEGGHNADNDSGNANDEDRDQDNYDGVDAQYSNKSIISKPDLQIVKAEVDARRRDVEKQRTMLPPPPLVSGDLALTKYSKCQIINT